jgi:hypothetical protein
MTPESKEAPRCVYCGDLHPYTFAEHDCPNSMGLDIASIVQTRAARKDPHWMPDKPGGAVLAR